MHTASLSSDFREKKKTGFSNGNIIVFVEPSFSFLKSFCLSKCRRATETSFTIIIIIIILKIKLLTDENENKFDKKLIK